jgi:hypothetical protein
MCESSSVYLLLVTAQLNKRHISTNEKEGMKQRHNEDMKDIRKERSKNKSPFSYGYAVRKLRISVDE